VVGFDAAVGTVHGRARHAERGWNCRSPRLTVAGSLAHGVSRVAVEQVSRVSM
jgi:hypothetical protein